MGLWDTLTSHAKAQFLDVIEWLDDSRNTVVYRFPVFNQAITDQSKLIVREGQAAVFVSEGRLSDVFGPGTYTLDTRNQAITSFFSTIKYGLNYPYKGDIYFVNTTVFRENRWGTSSPFMMRDAEFGPVRVRAFGTYDFRVTDPGAFLKQIVGTDGLFTTDEITGDLKKKLVSQVAQAVNQARIPILDLASAHDQLGGQIRDRVNPSFVEAYGVTITNLTIENIGLPPEVEKALDQRSRMGILGNLDAYAKMNAADAIGDAARNPGLGGAGVGMGVGFGMGNMMGQQMTNAMGQGGTFDPQTGMAGGGAPPPVPSATFHYNGPTGQAQLSAQEIAQRVAADRDGNHLVWAAGWPQWKPWKDVPEIAGQVPPPAAAPPPIAQGSTLHYHGPGGQGEKPVSEIAGLIQAAPDADHHVWKPGWDGWRPAKDVPEVQQALAATQGPPPPPGGPSGGPPPPPE